MRRVLLFLLAALFLIGCNMTPEQRCGLIKAGTQFGVKIALDKGVIGLSAKDRQDKIQTAAKIITTIEAKVLPGLKGEQPLVSREDLDKALGTLDSVLPAGEVKEAVQLSINSALQFVQIPEKGSIARNILDAVVCVFEGVLSGFRSHYLELKEPAKATTEKRASGASQKLFWPRK